jgi:hypothetical protein
MSTLSVDTITGQTTAANIKMPNGHIVGWKTQNAANSTQTSSSTYADITNMTLDYACKYSTSIVYILVHVHVFIPQQATNWQTVGLKILKGSTSLYTDGSGTAGTGHYTDSANNRFMEYISIQAAHAPADTNSHTYKVQGAKLVGSNAADFNNGSYGGGGRITVMEIAQ